MTDSLSLCKVFYILVNPALVITGKAAHEHTLWSEEWDCLGPSKKSCGSICFFFLTWPDKSEACRIKRRHNNKYMLLDTVMSLLHVFMFTHFSKSFILVRATMIWIIICLQVHIKNCGSNFFARALGKNGSLHTSADTYYICIVLETKSKAQFN